MEDSIFDKVRKADNPLVVQRDARKALISELGTRLNAHVAILYHNLANPAVMLGDDDVAMLEAVLAAPGPLKQKLVLVINSNGGLSLAAERIVHVARTYARKGFETMVVQKAKSAATMVCLGSDKIYMTVTAELGPTDPQIPVQVDGRTWMISVDSLLNSYDELMVKLRALDMNRENPAGLLQQLQRYEPSFVKQMRQEKALAQTLARDYLTNQMMSGEPADKIGKAVRAFTEAEEHKSHGRPIWPREASDLGLKVQTVRRNSANWKVAYELLQRYDHLVELEFVRNELALLKMVETADSEYAFRVPMGAL